MSTTGRTDANALSQLASGDVWSPGATAQTGTLRGQQVQVTDGPSPLGDAAEEVSMLFSEKVETLEHEQREVESGSHILVMEVEDITTYLEAAKAFQDPARLAELAKRMLAAGGEPPRQLAYQQSRDPSHQYVLLQYAFRQGQSEGASAEVLDRLADAIAEMEDQLGPQIRAGLNSIGSASIWSQDAHGVETFQRTYRDVALGDLPLSQTLRLVLERLGGSSGTLIEQGLKAMIAALGADLAAVRPSRERIRLKTLRSDLYELTVINTVFEGCKTLEKRLQQRQGRTH